MKKKAFKQKREGYMAPNILVVRLKASRTIICGSEVSSKPEGYLIDESEYDW